MSIGTPFSGEAHRPGLTCPECGFFMEFSIVSLLQNTEHVCPGCGLVLSLDRASSGASLQALSQLQAAVENLEATRDKYSGK